MASDPAPSNANPAGKGLTYAQAGVDIDAGDAMVGLIKAAMRRTHGPRVLGKHGAFAGCLRLDYNERLFKRNYKDPVLVACTDGVGTKVKLAAALQRFNTVGEDLVAMSVNDLIVQGAEPLMFLDYIGIHRLDPAQAAELVTSVARGCELAGCALLGGETAEMPDVYAEGDFDLAGFAVGVCELHRLIDGSKASAGDVLIGLGSSGVHSNGYSLVRRIVDHAKLDLGAAYPELADEAHASGAERTLGNVLLEPTRIYARSVVSLLRSYKVKQVVTAMSHVTGGGLPGNVGRTLPDHLDARLSLSSFPRPAVFDFLQKHGDVEEQEMRRVFNCGIGYVLAVRPHFADAAMDKLRRAGEKVYRLGELTQGTGKVKLTGAPPR